MPSPKRIQIWREGYKTSGDIQRAALLGAFKGDDLELAIHRYNIKARVANMIILIKKNRDGDWCWGKARVFDNKLDAQRKYG